MQHFRVQTILNVSGIERPLCLSDLSGFLECNSLLRLEYAAEPSQTSRRNRCVRLGCERNGQDGTRSLCDNPMAGLTLGPTVSTGHSALRISCSAVEPRISGSTPDLDCVPVTIRSTSCSFASFKMPEAGRWPSSDVVRVSIPQAEKSSRSRRRFSLLIRHLSFRRQTHDRLFVRCDDRRIEDMCDFDGGREAPS